MPALKIQTVRLTTLQKMRFKARLDQVVPETEVYWWTSAPLVVRISKSYAKAGDEIWISAEHPGRAIVKAWGPGGHREPGFAMRFIVEEETREQSIGLVAARP